MIGEYLTIFNFSGTNFSGTTQATTSGKQDIIAIQVIFILGGITLFGSGCYANRNTHKATNQHAKVIKIFVERVDIK